MIAQITECLKWLDANSRSQDLGEIGVCLNKISILSIRLSEQKSDAFDYANIAEDEYKIGIATYIKDGVGGVAKLENEAIVACADLRREWTKAKNTYNRLKTFLDSLDKVLDLHKQRVSTEKATSLKNI